MRTVLKTGGVATFIALILMGAGCMPASPTKSTDTNPQPQPMPPVYQTDPAQPTDGTGPITNYEPGISDPGQTY